MISFTNYNANPHKRKTTDCVVRALTTAAEMKYEDVYKELFDISLKTGYMINEKRVYEQILASHNFVKIKQPKRDDGTKYLIGEIDLLEKNKTIVIRCANHLTCIKDNTVIDIWDCRRKAIGNYYVRKEK